MANGSRDRRHLSRINGRDAASVPILGIADAEPTRKVLAGHPSLQVDGPARPRPESWLSGQVTAQGYRATPSPSTALTCPVLARNGGVFRALPTAPIPSRTLGSQAIVPPVPRLA
jgi:hypothetical protein